MFTSMYMSSPSVAAVHVLAVEDVKLSWNYRRLCQDITDQTIDEACAAHHALWVKKIEAEHAEIIHEMQDEDGCQEWRSGWCSCDDCSEPVLDGDPDHRIHRPDDDLEDCRFDTIAERDDFYREIY